jgi:hypothetical protein
MLSYTHDGAPGHAVATRAHGVELFNTPSLTGRRLVLLFVGHDEDPKEGLFARRRVRLRPCRT